MARATEKNLQKAYLSLTFVCLSNTNKGVALSCIAGANLPGCGLFPRVSLRPVGDLRANLRRYHHKSISSKENVYMAFELPSLSYAYDALEPHIDAQTMQIHHDLHHGAYVNNLNTAIKDSPAASWSLKDLTVRLNEVP